MTMEYPYDNKITKHALKIKKMFCIYEKTILVQLFVAS